MDHSTFGASHSASATAWGFRLCSSLANSVHSLPACALPPHPASALQSPPDNFLCPPAPLSIRLRPRNLRQLDMKERLFRGRRGSRGLEATGCGPCARLQGRDESTAPASRGDSHRAPESRTSAQVVGNTGTDMQFRESSGDGDPELKAENRTREGWVASKPLRCCRWGEDSDRRVLSLRSPGWGAQQTS